MTKNFPNLIFGMILILMIIYIIPPIDFSIQGLPIMSAGIIFISGCLVGVLCHHYLRLYNESLKVKAEALSIESKFATILKNKSVLKFNRRVGALVFINYQEYMLVYSIERDVFYIMQGDECLSTSNTIAYTQTIKDLKNFIMVEYGEQMNDCVLINNIAYSKHLFNVDKFQINIENLQKNHIMSSYQTEAQESYDVDNLLDKINQFGMQSLTPEELKFLQDQK